MFSRMSIRCLCTDCSASKIQRLLLGYFTDCHAVYYYSVNHYHLCTFVNLRSSVNSRNGFLGTSDEPTMGMDHCIA